MNAIFNREPLLVLYYFCGLSWLIITVSLLSVDFVNVLVSVDFVCYWLAVSLLYQFLYTIFSQ